MEQHFFQSFFGLQQEQPTISKPGYIIHNECILEIVNNWDCVKDLMKRFVEGKLKNVQIDKLDHDLFNYITNNKIDITKYSNEEEFLEAFWKTP